MNYNIRIEKLIGGYADDTNKGYGLLKTIPLIKALLT